MNTGLKEKLRLLPTFPGVYLMKDLNGKVIYVGKAINLRNRVRSYFNGFNSHDDKTKELVTHICDFEYIVTDTEVEALVLESILIKKYEPKYNIRIPDNRHFIYIKVTIQEPYPRLLAAHEIKKDGAKYFGPYPNSWAVRHLIDILSKVFRLRTCNKKIDGSQPQRPCLSYHIKMCQGPCTGKLDEQVYRQEVDKVLSYLSGRESEVIKNLKQEMLQAAENLQFEKAARIRDQISGLEGALEKQKIVSGKLEDMDIISLARGVEDTCVTIMFMRQGHIIGRDNNFISGSEKQTRESIYSAFIKQYYAGDTFVPREIYIDGQVAEKALLEQWLTEKSGRGVYIHVPLRGDKKQLCLMAHKNAMLAVEERWQRRKNKDDVVRETLQELAFYLKLPQKPLRIECYDISNTQGTDSVGSMVVFKDGKSAKAHYRRFKIKTVAGPNDFDSMKEVLTRRLKRLASKDVSFKEKPDLIMIDGGKGQLSSAYAVLQMLKLTDIAMVSLAKKEELLYLPQQSEPIVLPRQSRSLYLVQQIRDEAHRFAIEYHRHLRAKRQIASRLTEIAGVGAVRRRELLAHFGSVQAIKKATVEDLAAVKGMNRKVAENVYKFFHK